MSWEPFKKKADLRNQRVVYFVYFLTAPFIVYNNRSTLMDIQDKGIQHVIYICGYRKCGKEISLRVNDAIKCDKCGYRILYKKRRTDENEPIQYQAI